MLKENCMEHKEAATILIKLLGKNILDAEEKEAVLTAIGVLAWTSLSKSRIKAMGDKHKKIVNGESEIKRRKRLLRH
jgi:hypothetical protein